MLRLNRWIAAVLAVCLLMNTIPVYAFEETGKTIPIVEPTSEVTEQASPEQSPSEPTAAVTQTEQTSQENQQET